MWKQGLTKNDIKEALRAFGFASFTFSVIKQLCFQLFNCLFQVLILILVPGFPGFLRKLQLYIFLLSSNYFLFLNFYTLFKNQRVFAKNFSHYHYSYFQLSMFSIFLRQFHFDLSIITNHHYYQIMTSQAQHLNLS